MNGGAIARGSAVVFVAAMLQTVIVSAIVIGGGAPDLLLVVVISLGLLRGSISGAVYGFAGGLSSTSSPWTRSGSRRSS